MDEIIDFSSAKLEDFKFVNEAKNTEPVKEEIVENTVSSNEVQEPIVQDNVQQEEPNIPAPSIDDVKSPQKEDTEYKWKDDFIKQVVEFYEKTGDLTPYLQAKLVDFNSMSDEEILRRNLREQYAELSDKAFDRLYKQQVNDKYKLDADEYGEDDSELGRELLKAEASKIRNQYLEWQNGFKAPEPEISNEQNDAIEMMKRFEQEVVSNEFTKSLMDGKKLSIKTSDGEFNYEIPEANSLVEMTVNNDKFFSQFANSNGQLDYARWYKTAAYSQNPELFEKSLINYGKTLGRTEVTKEIKNPSTSSVSDVPTESSGDFTTGLLQAFANRGISK
jgi:hypothetical protein